MKKHIGFFLFSSLLLASCLRDKDDVKQPAIPVEEGEVITTVVLPFIHPVSGDTTEFSFSDPDGIGGNAPLIDTILLEPGLTYTAELFLLNESTDPPGDLTGEVEEEAEDHILCYEESGTGLSIDALDNDGTFPLGLRTSWTTGPVSQGTVRIRLKHQPGLKDGTCVPGETDMEVEFEVKVE